MNSATSSANNPTPRIPIFRLAAQALEDGRRGQSLQVPLPTPLPTSRCFGKGRGDLRGFEQLRDFRCVQAS